MITDYEILENFTKENDIWTYLKHKMTGFEIAFHKCETEEEGFSFNFRTPVEDPYLGTSHVLEHCILCGSRQYKFDFSKLLSFSCHTISSAESSWLSTRFYFYSTLEEEIFKIIPILADYVFFAELSEEAFMQECMRVEFCKDDDGRKREIAGVVYNEMKTINSDASYYGGTCYKLHELTNDKIKEYYKKYYKPENCLFVFNGNADLETLLTCIDQVVSKLQCSFNYDKTITHTHLTCQQVLDKIPFIETPEDSDIGHWLIDKDNDICEQIAGYWEDGFSPLIPFCLDEKYAYSCHKWWEENNTIPDIPPLPPRKKVQAIISEYLKSVDKTVYKTKLEKLYKWQNRDTRNEMYRIMVPLTVEKYDIDIKSPKSAKENKERYKNLRNKYQVVETIVDKDVFSICFKPSEIFSKDFYAEFALIIYLGHCLFYNLRESGMLYSLNALFNPPFLFEICTKSSNKSKNTLRTTIKLIKNLADYSFNEIDLLMIKSLIFSRVENSAYTQNFQTGDDFITNDIFKVTKDDLHNAAIRFKKNIESVENNQNFYTGTINNYCR